MGKAVEIAALHNMAKVCTIEGCNNKVFSRGLCNFHAPKKAIVKKIPLKKKPPKKVPATARSEKPRGRKVHKKKRESVKQLKSKLWTVFSKFVRIRDADREGFITCITSGARMWWQQSQAGHFMSRRYNATFIHEKNVHAQSPHSNMFLAGEQYIYGKRLDELYGQGTADEMVRLSKTEFKFTIEWLKEKTDYYTKEVERMRREKGL